MNVSYYLIFIETSFVLLRKSENRLQIFLLKNLWIEVEVVLSLEVAQGNRLVFYTTNPWIFNTEFLFVTYSAWYTFFK